MDERVKVGSVVTWGVDPESMVAVGVVDSVDGFGEGGVAVRHVVYFKRNAVVSATVPLRLLSKAMVTLATPGQAERYWEARWTSK